MSLSLDGECLKSRANKDGFYLVTAAFSTVPAYNDDKNIKGFFFVVFIKWQSQVYCSGLNQWRRDLEEGHTGSGWIYPPGHRWILWSLGSHPEHDGAADPPLTSRAHWSSRCNPKLGSRTPLPHRAACGLTLTGELGGAGGPVFSAGAFRSISFGAGCGAAFHHQVMLIFLWIPTSRKYMPHLCYNEKTNVGKGK